MWNELKNLNKISLLRKVSLLTLKFLKNGTYEQAILAVRCFVRFSLSRLVG